MNRFFRKSQSTVEYVMLIAITVAALLGMTYYFRNSIAGKWRESADVFGHGRLYVVSQTPPGGGSETVTIHVKISNLAGQCCLWEGNVTVLAEGTCCYGPSCEEPCLSLHCWTWLANNNTIWNLRYNKWLAYWGINLYGHPVGQYPSQWNRDGGAWHHYYTGLVSD